MAKRIEREKSRGREQIMIWVPRELKRWVAQAAKRKHRGNMTYYIESLLCLAQERDQRYHDRRK